MRPRGPVVAIDGPAGSGKTSVSRQVAQALGFMVLDTGALYRALALATLDDQLPADSPELGAFCERLVSTRAIRLEPKADGTANVFLHDRDVSSAIREPRVSRRASEVSIDPAVRAALLSLQREAGQLGGVVVEGRDIGTVVFPDAEAKFFLTASVERRSERRLAELTGAGRAPSIEEVQREVVERDRRDSTRAVAPLVRAPDAELVDSTHLSVDAVVEHIVGRVRQIMAARKEPRP